jgi:Vps53-like, N-terminal.
MLNKHFPTELSLSAVESHCERLAVKMHSLDMQILQAVEHQSSAGSAAQRDLEVANESVEQLTAHLSLIRSKALDTEHAVRDICSDIQTLDYAKRNLTSTITALRRLSMLETAIHQLSVLTEERGYREAANLLEATSQLAANFDSYKSVPKICELMASVRALRSQLQAQVFEEFKEHINVTMTEEVTSMLADAAQVVTVLGPALVNKLTLWFCERELAEYDAGLPSDAARMPLA